ncbi:MAG: MEDS domain-containing protein [Methanoregula sp.]|nr:MAG: MEDS domain-containing protein [Methanoregula sp.]
MATTHTPIKRISDIKPGDHLCCIYSTEEEHRAVITQFLRAGLEQNEKVFYIVDVRTRDVVINYLKIDGVDVDYYLNKGQFTILTIADAYMKDGVFDPDRMIALLASETRKALDQGFSALRVTGEMSWALRSLPGSERLIEYENKLNTFIPGSRCLAICQYDRRRFDAGILLDIFLTHPFAFIGADLYDNFYYTPPEDILKPDRQKTTLNRWIKNIKDHNATEEALRDSEEKFRTLFENMLEGFAYCRMLYDKEGRPADFVYLNVNPAFGRISGTKMVTGKPVTEVFPGIKEAYPSLFEIYGRVALTGKPETFDLDFKPSGKWLHISVYSPAKEYFVAVFEDITKRKQAEMELESAQQKLKEAHRLAHIGIWDWLIENDTVTWSEELYNIAGRDLSLPAPTYAEHPHVYTPTSWDRLSSAVTRALTSGEPYNLELELIRPDGSKRWVNAFGGVTRNPDGKIIGLHGTVQDITERKYVEESLKESELKFRMIVDWTYDWEYWVDPDRKFVYISPSVERITGYRAEEFMADPDLIDRIVHPDDRKSWDAHVRIYFATINSGPAEIEFRIIHKDGSERWISHRCRSICFDDGNCIGRRVSNRDFTDYKLMEAEIRSLNAALEQRVEQRTAQLNASLEDKIVLLREVHHRVKNNLQIIISLLNLQSRYIEDEKTLQVIKESQNRVRAMALVHEKLYQSTDIAEIDLDNYIRFLGDSLFRFYGMTGTGINFITRIQDINVGINTAIPLGLIVNELVSNSLKHAFPDKRRGEISITIRRENDLLHLVYKDNGVGIPPDFDWRTAKSLGLRLIISLVEQLQGTIELDRTEGTKFTIIVKEKE